MTLGILSWLIAKDEALFFFLNNRLGEIPGLQYLLGWPTFFGEAYIILPLCFLFLLVWDPKQCLRVLILIAAATLIAHFASSTLKHLIGRPRPYGQFFSEYVNGLVHIHVMFKRIVSASFPSGHTVDITAAVIALNLLYQHRLKWLYLLIPWVAVTRVYVGAHFPLDTLGGFIVGSLVTLLLFWGLKKAGWLEKLLKA